MTGPTAEQALGRVLALAHVGKRKQARWAHVAKLTSFGSTASAELCRRFGLDPDADVGGSDPVDWGKEPATDTRAVDADELIAAVNEYEAALTEQAKAEPAKWDRCRDRVIRAGNRLLAALAKAQP